VYFPADKDVDGSMGLVPDDDRHHVQQMFRLATRRGRSCRVTFAPRFTITNRITADLTTIERARGFLDAATLSEEWVRRMSQRALLLEAHHTTHIEGTQLSVEQAEQVWAGYEVKGANADERSRVAQLPRGLRPRERVPLERRADQRGAHP
jgi:hypothetical protein